jgi:hypothetical protein
MLCLVNLFSSPLQATEEYNGFSLSGSLVDSTEVLHGGPPRDGIPALTSPAFVSSGQSIELADDDQVLGLKLNGISKAYPVRILNYHEIVNDHFETSPVLISYCPLCGTGMGFHAKLAQQTLTFGVSGLLYNSDVLMYDLQTESLWSQIMAKAISGQLRAKQLQTLPLEHTTWRDWKNRHPDTKVLSFETGFSRNYQRSPYGNYDQNERLYFPVKHRDRRYHPKEIVLGIEVDGHYKVYPMVELGKASSPISDTLNGKPFTLLFDSQSRSGRALTHDGKAYPVLRSYWFAWAAFHPNTLVWTHR